MHNTAVPVDPSLPPLPTPQSLPVAAKSRGKTLLSLLVFALMVVGGYVLGGWLAGSEAVDSEKIKWGFSELQKGLLLAALVPVMFLVLAVHEIGHVLGGQLARFRFVLLIVGPLRLYRAATGALRLGHNKSLALYGGLAMSLPTDNNNLSRRMALTVAGGPVTSLLAGLLSALPLLLPSMRDLHPDTHSTAQFFGIVLLRLFCLTTVLIGLVTLFPGRTSGFATDGARLLRFLRGGPAARQEAALMGLFSQATAGARPRDFDLELLQQARGDGDDLLRALTHQLTYSYHLDRGDVAQAREALALAVENWQFLPKTTRPNLALEAAYFEATVRRDADAARAWLAQAEDGAFTEAYLRHRAQAAIALAEEDVDRARAEARDGLRALKRALQVGGDEMVREQLQAMAG